MSLLADAIGIVALVPAMAGPLSLPVADDPAGLVLTLCQGGTLAVPMEQQERPGTPATMCCAKGCQRQRSSRQVDPEQ